MSNKRPIVNKPRVSRRPTKTCILQVYILLCSFSVVYRIEGVDSPRKELEMGVFIFCRLKYDFTVCTTHMLH